MKTPLSLADAIREYSNDYNLGEYLRQAYQGSLNTPEIHEMIKEYPNNYELGKAARRQVLNS